MRWFFTFVTIVACAISCGSCVLAADEESETADEDSSAGLPEQYAKNYLIARSTSFIRNTAKPMASAVLPRQRKKSLI